MKRPVMPLSPQTFSPTMNRSGLASMPLKLKRRMLIQKSKALIPRRESRQSKGCRTQLTSAHARSTINAKHDQVAVGDSSWTKDCWSSAFRA